MKLGFTVFLPTDPVSLQALTDAFGIGIWRGGEVEPFPDFGGTKVVGSLARRVAAPMVAGRVPNGDAAIHPDIHDDSRDRKQTRFRRPYLTGFVVVSNNEADRTVNSADSILNGDPQFRVRREGRCASPSSR